MLLAFIGPYRDAGPSVRWPFGDYPTGLLANRRINDSRRHTSGRSTVPSLCRGALGWFMAGVDGSDRGDVTRPFEESITYGDAVARLLAAEQPARATIPALTLDTDRSVIEVPTRLTPEEDTEQFMRELDIRSDVQLTMRDELSTTPLSDLDGDSDERRDDPTGFLIADGDPASTDALAHLAEAIAIVHDRVFNPGRPAAESDLRFRVGDDVAPLAYVTANVRTRSASRLGNRRADDDLPVFQSSVTIDTSCRALTSPFEAQQIAATVAGIIDVAHKAGGNVRVDNAHVACEIARRSATHRINGVSVTLSAVSGDSLEICVGATTLARRSDLVSRSGVFADLRADDLNDLVFGEPTVELARALAYVDAEHINIAIDAIAQRANDTTGCGDVRVQSSFNLKPITTNFDRWLNEPVVFPDGMTMGDLGLEDFGVNPDDVL